MDAFIGPVLVVIPGFLALVWSALAVRRANVARNWTPVAGRVVAQEQDAHGVVDVVEYPLPDGGTRTTRPEAHGHYESGHSIGTQVTVWRDPVDALNSVLELPRLDQFAGRLLVGILGTFFLGGGLVWAGLILALVSR
jgi:Protein of unknown function (DUF3592)